MPDEERNREQNENVQSTNKNFCGLSNATYYAVNHAFIYDEITDSECMEIYNGSELSYQLDRSTESDLRHRQARSTEQDLCKQIVSHQFAVNKAFIGNENTDSERLSIYNGSDLSLRLDRSTGSDIHLQPAPSSAAVPGESSRSSMSSDSFSFKRSLASPFISSFATKKDKPRSGKRNGLVLSVSNVSKESDYQSVPSVSIVPLYRTWSLGLRRWPSAAGSPAVSEGHFQRQASIRSDSNLHVLNISEKNNYDVAEPDVVDLGTSGSSNYSSVSCDTYLSLRGSVTKSPPTARPPLPSARPVKTPLTPTSAGKGLDAAAGKGRRGRCGLVVKVTILIAVALAIVSVIAWRFSSPPAFSDAYLQTATVEMRLNDTYQPAMADLNSTVAQAYSANFCSNLGDSIKNSLYIVDCQVTSLTNGSVVVVAELTFGSINLTSEDVQQALTKSLDPQAVGNVSSPGLIHVYLDSIRVISVINADLDCTRPGPLYRPYDYTYPSSCSHHKLCINGLPIHQTCFDGMEFFPDDTCPCHPPSDETYCGIKRRASLTALTTSLTTQPTSAATSPTMSMTTAENYAGCPDLDARIWNQSSALYSCPPDGTLFIPGADTYPNNCSSFVWCVQGRHYNFSCPLGTHFVWADRPCTWESDKRTFCQQKSQATICREQGFTLGSSATVTAKPAVTTVSENVFQATNCTGIEFGSIPAVDTYPDRCGRFVECVRFLEQEMACPADLHFSPSGYCVWPDSAESYCNQRKAATSSLLPNSSPATNLLGLASSPNSSPLHNLSSVTD